MTPHEPTPATPTPVAAPAAPAPLSPQAAERARIYEQHFAPPAPATPDPAAAPAAPVEVAPPAPVFDGIPPAPPEAVPPPLTTEQVLSSLVDKIGQLEQRMAAPPPAPAPAAPPAGATPQEQADWLTLLSQGKRAEAEAAMAAMIARQNSANEQALQSRVLAQVAAERDMQDFTQQVRTQNADIAEMESYIAPRVQHRLNEAMQSGRVKSPADYATVYKELLTDELKQARNFYLRVRGAGAAQAGVRQSQVVAAPTLAPQAVATPQAPTPSEPEIETPQAYLARRQQRNAAYRGLAS